MTKPVNPLKAFMEASKAAKVKEVIEKANGTHDEQLVHDMIEGETSFYEILSELVANMMESKAQIAAAKIRAEDLAVRKKRFENRLDAQKRLAVAILKIAGEKKAELLEATLSLRAGSQKALIEDESLLPKKYIEYKPNPKTGEIGEALRSGIEVPGAILIQGNETLAMRTR